MRTHALRKTLFALVAALVALPVAAQVDTGLSEVGQSSGLATGDLPTLIGNIISAFLGLLGVVAVVLIIYAGFQWMTAGGNEEKIATAKRTLTNAVIGLVIIFASFAIVQFVIRALTGATGGGIGFGGNGSGGAFSTLGPSGRGQDALGNGVVDYHYPESGQTDVPRNARISVTFKKPFKLSTVLANYDDAGTYTTADDRLCPSAAPCPDAPLVSSVANPVFALNTANVVLIPNDRLGGVNDFDSRYPAADVLAARASVTAVPETFELGQYQTLTFRTEQLLGSPSGAVNYRVAFRGGDTGVQVWSMPATGGAPAAVAAFSRTFADGGYYWPFATGTNVDTQPPQVVSVEPRTTLQPGTPASSVLTRNQLLQVYFSEAVDPTTASGVIGAGGGFANLEVIAQCLPGTFPGSCSFNGGNPGTVDGRFILGNRYRTAEFTPTAPCEGVATNSCGDPVRCLPRNVSITVRALAATVGSEPPAATDDNGITDMNGNSLDGNRDGTAQGPQPPAQPNGRLGDFFLNSPQTGAALNTVSDTVRWTYHVGSDVDLVVPRITALDPPAAPPEGAPHPQGPSVVPPNLAPSITWSKTMSIASMRTGGFDESTGSYRDAESTIVLRSKECAKNGTAECPVPPTQCACTRIDPPGFFIDAGEPFEDPAGSGNYVTKIRLVHPVRPFYTANDLGYTAQDIANYPDNIPAYVPIARAQVRDTKQNCFYPSAFKPTVGSPECTLAPGQTSCCERVATGDGSFLDVCAP